MLAAKTNSIESVKLLLKKNADTSICDENNFTALTYGILSGNIEIIEILIRKTNSFLDVSLMKLAESKFRVNQKIKDLVKEILKKDADLLWTFLERASMFGNSYWLKWLLDYFPMVDVDEFGWEWLMNNAIRSDNAKACKLILSKYQVVSTELQELVLKRGKTAVIKALKLKGKKLRNKLGRPNFGTYRKVIKTEEFAYYNTIAHIKTKLMKNKQRGRNVRLSIRDLLNDLKALQVHYSKKYENGCPNDCKQKRKCLRIRQTVKIVLGIMKVISKKHGIFEDPELIVVGSMKEGTKVCCFFMSFIPFFRLCCCTN